jgi:TonB family protein
MTLNMPNFTSSGGSWVVRFAELKPATDTGDLVPPVATVKVDPAYPAEAQREGLTGTVILYAVIHADGSVGEIRVLRSLDDRLDASARTALERWRFRPGSRNGTAVELEAVIQIPFKPGRPGLQ